MEWIGQADNQAIYQEHLYGNMSKLIMYFQLIFDILIRNGMQ